MMDIRVPMAISRWLGDGNSDGGGADAALHDYVTAALTYGDESVLRQQCADLLAGEHAKLTQPQPPVA